MLMVSGIGPRKTLDPLGIEVLSDRPGVGQNMWVRYTDKVFSLSKSHLDGFYMWTILYYFLRMIH